MKKMVVAALANNFVQGGIWLTFTTIVISLMNFFYNLIILHFLPLREYGEIAAFFSYLAIMSVPVNVFVINIIRKLGQAKNKIEKARAYESWFYHKLFSLRYFFILYFLSALIIPSITNLSLLTSLALLIMFLLFVISAFYNGIFQGMQFFVTISLITIFSTGFKLLGAVLVALNIDGIMTIFVCLILSGILSIGLAKLILAKKSIGSAGNHHVQRKILAIIFSRDSILTLLSLIGIAIISNLDIIYAKKFLDPTSSGLYAAWNLFAKIVVYVTGSIASVSLIFFADQTKKHQHMKALFLTLLTFIAAGVAVFFVYQYFGDIFVTTLASVKARPIVIFLPQAAYFGTLYSIILILNNFFLAKSSVFSTVTILMSPVYALLLLLFGQNIEKIITINMIVSSILVIGYLLCLSKYYLKEKKDIKLLSGIS